MVLSYGARAEISMHKDVSIMPARVGGGWSFMHVYVSKEIGIACNSMNKVRFTQAEETAFHV